jgi:hypothetical protein
MTRGKFGIGKYSVYPHLLYRDVAIWERFLEVLDHGFDSFDYDVHVGSGVEVKDDWPDEIKTMALALSEKRIDVVGWKGESGTIIEVKAGASLSAVGQVLCYRVLYKQRFALSEVSSLLIVTDYLTPDMVSLCGGFDIGLRVV